MSGCWNRLKRKISETGLCSPIKPTIGHVVLKKDLAKTPYIRALIWALLNMEEFYYQNSGSLVIQNMDDFDKLNKKLKSNRNVLKWQSKLTNYQFLGQGTFGTVFKATDTTTSSTYAVKEIKQKFGDDEQRIYGFIKNLLLERNTSAELNRCPFFVRLIAAYQKKDGIDDNFVFVMELCVGDLSQFCSINIEGLNDKQLVKYFKRGMILKKLNHNSIQKWGIDYEKLIFIYFFEMLTALHYLATKHVVHADLKPQNVLISQTGHIKIADMGLAFKDQWTSSRALTSLTSNWKQLDNIENEPKSIVGTFSYYDPELAYRKVSMLDVTYFDKLTTRYNGTLSKLEPDSIRQIFLSDLFAIGLIMIDLTCGTYRILKDIDKYIEVIFWIVDLVYDKELKKNFLEKHLMKMAEPSPRRASVMKLLLSIFQPRKIRSKFYLSAPVVDLTNEQTDMALDRYIDIQKVENLSYYKKHDITKENVLNYDFKDFANKFAREIANSNKETDTSVPQSTALQTIQNLRVAPFDYADF